MDQLNAAIPRAIAGEIQACLRDHLDNDTYEKIDWNKWLPLIMQILTMLLPLIVQPQPAKPD